MLEAETITCAGESEYEGIPESVAEIFDISNKNRKKNKQRKKEKAAKNKANVVGYDDVTALIKSFAKMDGKENAFRKVCDLGNNEFASYLGWGHESRNESHSPVKQSPSSPQKPTQSYSTKPFSLQP